MIIRAFQSSDQLAVIQLWQDSGLIHPKNNPVQDIERKAQEHPEWFLVGLEDDKIVATCMAGYDGHRGWLNYLAVAPSHQKSGLGSAIVSRAEELLRNAGCPKINLQVRSSNTEVIKFYERLGFMQDQVISLGKRLQESDQPFPASSKVSDPQS